MRSKPGGDSLPIPAGSPDLQEWTRVLAHRRRDSPETVSAVVERFRSAGVTAATVADHLRDAGDRLYAGACSDDDQWAEDWGGARAAALLAAEVSALMSHLVARAASVRSVCVDTLLDDFSAVTVAGALGVSRQKVYELSRADIDPDFLRTTPWRAR